VPNTHIARPNPGIGTVTGHLPCFPWTTPIAPSLRDTRETGEIAMHAAYWSHPGPGAAGVASADIPAKRRDRLDLLARAIHLQSDSIAFALSPSIVERTPAHWDVLLDEAEDLGRQWAASDPVDALRLLPSLLTGPRSVTERFAQGYDAAMHPHDRHQDEDAPPRDRHHARRPRTRVCDHCDTNVTFLLDGLDSAAMACPCCGQSWMR
jgi:hypothetical protein